MYHYFISLLYDNYLEYTRVKNTPFVVRLSVSGFLRTVIHDTSGEMDVLDWTE